MKTKKDFTGGLSSLLGETPQQQPIQDVISEKAAKESKQVSKTSQIGTKINETRATFIVNEDVLEKVKAVAYWDRVQIKDVIDDALSDYLSKYEKTSGPIKPIPKK